MSYYRFSFKKHQVIKDGFATQATISCCRCGNIVDNMDGPDNNDTFCESCYEKFQMFMRGPNFIQETIFGVPLIKDMHLVTTGKDSFGETYYYAGVGRVVLGKNSPKILSAGRAKAAKTILLRKGYSEQDVNIVPIIVMKNPSIM